MQPEDRISEITFAIEKVNVMVSDIFDYLNDKPDILKHYQKENCIRAAIALDYINQALAETEKLEKKIRKGV